MWVPKPRCCVRYWKRGDVRDNVDERMLQAVIEHRGKRHAAIVDRLFGERQSAATASPKPRAPRQKSKRPIADKQGFAAPPTFVAIDFETANHQRDSACSVALVRVEAGLIVERRVQLIRPVPRNLQQTPRELFHPRMTDLHGLAWEDVRRAPAFREVWQRLAPLLDGAEVLVAHNAPFDRSVLNASCKAAGLKDPGLPFLCTVQMARACWSLCSARLPVVARYLDLSLTHHDPLSDATVCAQIACAAFQRRPSVFEVQTTPSAPHRRRGQKRR